MRRAMEYSLGLDMILAQHCEVARLTGGAVMHEGRCCSDLGLPGWPAVRRGADGPPRHRARPPHRRSHPPAAPLDGAPASSSSGPRRPTGSPSPPRSRPHHLALTDEALRGYDPLFKVNPPLRTAADVAALKAGLADGTIDAIATDHAPHTTDDKERPIDDAPPGMLGLETALGVALAELDLPLRRPARRAVVEAGGDRRRRRPPRHADRARQRGQPGRVRPRRPPGRSVPPRSPAAAATPRTSAETSAAGSATRSSEGRRSCAMGLPNGECSYTVLHDHPSSFSGQNVTERSPGALSSPTGPRSRGTCSAPAPLLPARSCSTRRLSGYQEILTDPSYAGQIITFTNPHIGNYGVNATDFEARRPFCRGVVVRELSRRPSNRRSEADLDAMLRRYGIPGITGIDTRRLTRLIRDTGAIPGAFGPADDLDDLRGHGGGRARHRRHRPRRHGDDARGLRGRRRRRHDRRLRLRDQADDPSPARPVRPGRGRPRHDDGDRGAGPASGRRVPVQRSRRPGRGAVRRAGDPRAARGGADLRHLPRPPAARTGARRRHGEAAVRPPRRQPPGQGPHDRHDRDHQPEPQLRGRRLHPARRRRADPCQPQRWCVRGARRRRGTGVLGAAPPRGGAGTARQPVPLRPLPRGHRKRCRIGDRGEPTGLPRPELGVA